MTGSVSSSNYRRFVEHQLSANSHINILPALTVCRDYSSSSEPDLKSTLKRLVPEKRELLKKVKAQSDKSLGEVKIENTLGGMRYTRTIPKNKIPANA